MTMRARAHVLRAGKTLGTPRLARVPKLLARCIVPLDGGQGAYPMLLGMGIRMFGRTGVRPDWRAIGMPVVPCVMMCCRNTLNAIHLRDGPGAECVGVSSLKKSGEVNQQVLDSVSKDGSRVVPFSSEDFS